MLHTAVGLYSTLHLTRDPDREKSRFIGRFPLSPGASRCTDIGPGDRQGQTEYLHVHPD